jgi:23S rRNA pseudouridine1911/1915/1917 synthase
MKNEVALSGACPDECRGQRLDQVLGHLFDDYSRSRLQQWIKDGLVKVDGDVITKNRHKLLGGEQLEVQGLIEEHGEWQANDIPLNIVYEDDSIMIIDKPIDLVVHPAAGHENDTLVNGLLFHNPSLATIPRAGIVHRLDKDTSGLLVVAKTLQAHANLVDQLQSRKVSRIYHAVCCGEPVSGGTIEEPIGRHPKHSKKMAVHPLGKEAITHYRIHERFRNHTYLRVKLETGRTHQIRVHMAFKGYPLFGDQTYGQRLKLIPNASDELNEFMRAFKRQALHAAELGLAHPVSGELMQWESPLPEDMLALIDLLREDVENAYGWDDDEDYWDEDY